MSPSAASSLGARADDVGAPFNLLVAPLERARERDLATVELGETGSGHHIGSCGRKHPGAFGSVRLSRCAFERARATSPSPRLSAGEICGSEHSLHASARADTEELPSFFGGRTGRNFHPTGETT